MPELSPQNCPALEATIWQLYREFFDKAERKRRWKITDDIPWDECNRNLDPAIADVVESFCAIELFLPDFTAKILPVVRPSMGRVWFYANWGYEESKHSLALGDWLRRSGHRSEEQMADLEKKVFEREWNLPHDSAIGMLVYAMAQELATFLNYRNLRHRCAARGGDPALEKLLNYVAIDEMAHHSFFMDCLKLYIQHDRDVVVEQLRRVLNGFQMPAIHDLLDESQRRIAQVRDLDIFSETIFYSEVYMPVLVELGVTRAELRGKPNMPIKKSTVPL